MITVTFRDIRWSSTFTCRQRWREWRWHCQRETVVVWIKYDSNNERKYHRSVHRCTERRPGWFTNWPGQLELDWVCLLLFLGSLNRLLQQFQPMTNKQIIEHRWRLWRGKNDWFLFHSLENGLRNGTSEQVLPPEESLVLDVFDLEELKLHEWRNTF